KTGCWLLVAAQHITAVNGVVHYISPRLRAEAPQEVSDIMNDVHDLIDDLREARRAEALKLQRELRDLQAHYHRAQEELQMYRARDQAASHSPAA
ncbi:hypothetical protein FA13DRAFT_1622470, partial [Coprinellus micaceus]